jgi:hypothetical protein
MTAADGSGGARAPVADIDAIIAAALAEGREEAATEIKRLRTVSDNNVLAGLKVLELLRMAETEIARMGWLLRNLSADSERMLGDGRASSDNAPPNA